MPPKQQPHDADDQPLPTRKQTEWGRYPMLLCLLSGIFILLSMELLLSYNMSQQSDAQNKRTEEITAILRLYERQLAVVIKTLERQGSDGGGGGEEGNAVVPTSVTTTTTGPDTNSHVSNTVRHNLTIGYRTRSLEAFGPGLLNWIDGSVLPELRQIFPKCDITVANGIDKEFTRQVHVTLTAAACGGSRPINDVMPLVKEQHKKDAESMETPFDHLGVMLAIHSGAKATECYGDAGWPKFDLVVVPGKSGQPVVGNEAKSFAEELAAVMKGAVHPSTDLQRLVATCS